MRGSASTNLKSCCATPPYCPRHRDSVLLRADTASLSLDVSESLFGWRVTGDRFTIDGAELDIRRDSSGELFILGVPVSSIKPRGQAVLADIRLRGGRVVFHDEMEGGGRWAVPGRRCRLKRQR